MTNGTMLNRLRSNMENTFKKWEKYKQAHYKCVCVYIYIH